MKERETKGGGSRRKGKKKKKKKKKKTEEKCGSHCKIHEGLSSKEVRGTRGKCSLCVSHQRNKGLEKI